LGKDCILLALPKFNLEGLLYFFIRARAAEPSMPDVPLTKDFIREAIDEDLKSGRFTNVHTRFPPEPNGYLHIGHAKAIWIDYGIARDYGGKFNLRFDDTNPAKEEQEYVDAIIEDVRWLGADWEGRLFYASDYFEQMYLWAEELIKKGKAYVCDLGPDEVSQYRGTLTEPGKESPGRNRSFEENLSLFRKMRAGEFPDGSKTLRAKIDIAHPNMNMRDPVMYRILHKPHHRQGDKWCVYPMYDWAHGLEDSIEGVTHSLCSLEYENHRPLYDWFLDQLGIYHPRQIEFARLNMTYTVMSKRLLLELVDGGHVHGWDDPRMPTITGMRRRGYPSDAIRDFLSRVGVAKMHNVIDVGILEHCVRENLNITALRYMGVINPLKLIIENLPEGHTEEMDVVNNPENPATGRRKVPFSRALYIERDDFMEEPQKKFFRLAPGREVRLRNAYLVTCTGVEKRDGHVSELRCRVDPTTRGGDAPDGRKVKSTLHWVSAAHAVEAEVRMYDRLFTVEDPSGQKSRDFKEFLNPDSLKVAKGCMVEPALRALSPQERFQFERLGYFCIDRDTSPGHLVINKTIGLRDTWAKVQGKQVQLP
jgi:glutaminyl-tRNA synthetase